MCGPVGSSSKHLSRVYEEHICTLVCEATDISACLLTLIQGFTDASPSRREGAAVNSLYGVPLGCSLGGALPQHPSTRNPAFNPSTAANRQAKEYPSMPGKVAHYCNPNDAEVEAGGSQVQS